MLLVHNYHKTTIMFLQVDSTTFPLVFSGSKLHHKLLAY